MSRLDSMMNQYEKNSTPSPKKTSQYTKYDENNYFGTRLNKGVNSATKQVRVIEPEDINASPFVEVNIHKKKVDGVWKTFMCPKSEKGDPCPFCEARELLLAAGTDEARKDAYQIQAKIAYIAKVIDRENPDHGVKFWRFNHHYKNAGVIDKINGANNGLPKGEDPFSNNLGRDLTITVTRDDNASIVSAVNYNMSQTPLSEDAEQVKAWTESASEKHWESVFPINPYDKLEIIVRGGIPVFVKDDSDRGGKFVDKASLDSKPKGPTEEFDSEISMGVPTTTVESVAPESVVPESVVPESVAPVVAESVVAESVVTPPTPSVDEEDDDLPF